MAVGRAWRITDRDLHILEFLTRYGAATAEQVRREFFAESVKAAYRRLRALEERGLVRGERIFYRMPQVYRATEQGARLAEVDLPPPRYDLSRLHHHLEVLELSYQLREDDEGVEDWITEREVRRDKLMARREKETGRMGPGGKMGRTPDGLLVLVSGDLVAVELELTAKRNADYKRILADYARQLDGGEVDAVHFYFASAKVMQRVEELSRGYDDLFGRIEFWRWEPVF
ncbi:MAG: hypothetical protein CYG60_02895, partial [Actinobacteria bacterium]